MRRRRLLGFITLGLLLAAGLTWYVNAVVLPGPARQWIATWLAEQTGRRVLLGPLTFRLWEGFVIDRVVIYEAPPNRDQPFLEIERVSGAGFYLPWRLDRRLIIPWLRLTHPRLRLVREETGVWNTETLRWLHPPAGPPPSGGPQQVAPRPLTAAAPEEAGVVRRPIAAAASPRPAHGRVTILLPRLTMTEGECVIEDRSRTPAVTSALTGMTLVASVAFPGILHLTGTCSWHTAPATPLSFRGTWQSASRQGRFSLTARHWPLAAVRPYLSSTPAHTLRELAGAATVILDGQVRKDHSAVRVALSTTDGRWQWRDWRGHGRMTVIGRGTVRHQRPLVWHEPHLSLHLQEVTLQGPTPWPTIERLTGRLRVTADGVEAPALTALIKTLPVRAQGTLTQPFDPPRATLDATVVSTAPLDAVWHAISPSLPRWLATTQVEGTGQLRLAIHGPLPQPTTTAMLIVHDGRLTTPATGPIEQLRGRLVLRPDLVTATSVRGVWRDAPVTLSGTLVNFAAPEIDGTLRWGEVTADAALTVEGPRVMITNLTTTYRRSRASTTGELTVGAGDLEGLLYSDVTLDLADALPWLPAGAARLRGWQPTGVFSGQLFLRGPLRAPRAWELGIKGHLPRLVVNGIRLEQVQGVYRQRQGEAAIPGLTALAYGGALSAQGTLSLTTPHQPFTAQVTLDHLELSRLIQDTPWRGQAVSGLLTAEAILHGMADALPCSLDGDGRAQVVEGRLFELPLLRGLADLLGAPALQRVTFREAAGTFTVHDETLRTSDLTCYSTLATLTATGSVNLQGALDAHVVTSLDPSAFEHAPALARTATQFLHTAGYLIGEVMLGGTLAHPTYEVVPVSLNRVLKEQVFERLRGLFEALAR